MRGGLHRPPSSQAPTMMALQAPQAHATLFNITTPKKMSVVIAFGLKYILAIDKNKQST